MSLKTVGTRGINSLVRTATLGVSLNKQVGVVAASAIKSSSQSYATSSTVYSKSFQSWFFGEPKTQDNRDSDFPEVEKDDLDGDDGDVSQDDAPEFIFESKKPIILPPGSLAQAVMRVYKMPKPVLTAASIRYAFKDMEETSVVRSKAFAETLETSVVKTKAHPKVLEQPQPAASTTQPKKSFWDMIKNALGVIGAAFTSAGGLVAYYAFPSTRSPEAA